MGSQTKSGMVAKAWFPRAAFNLHNQGLPRAEYQGSERTGFTVEFLGEKARRELDAALGRGVVAIRAATIEALVAETDQTKQLLRSYLDTVFRGSALHGNNHRRVSNAAAQSIYYNDVAAQGQVASLIYSKFGKGKGPTSFVDFLLLHIRGGSITAKSGGWMKIPNRAEPGSEFGQTGNFGISGSSIFTVPAKDDPNKLFLLRSSKSTGATKLLATLVKSIKVPARAAGVGAILAQRGARFESNFNAVFVREKAKAGAA